MRALNAVQTTEFVRRSVQDFYRNRLLSWRKRLAN